MEFDGGDVIAIILAGGSALWTGLKEVLGRSDKKRSERVSMFDIEVRGPAEQVLAKFDTSITNFDVLRRGTQTFNKVKKEAETLVATSRRVASESSRMLNKVHISHSAKVNWIELDDPFRDSHASHCDSIVTSKNREELDLAIANLVECETVFVQRIREKLLAVRRGL